jgi:dTMP kinase
MNEVKPKKGYFITLEGSDGAGKTTQADLIKKALEYHGFTIRMLREPGSTAIGEKIRDMFKSSDFKEMTPETELFLVSAARAQLVRQVIKPALEAGEVVICDRYYHSTVLYQGFGRGLDAQFIHAVIQFAIDGITPDITFLLHLAPDIAKSRTRERDLIKLDRIDYEADTYFANIQKGIEWLKSKADNNKLIAIDANDTTENIHNEIYRSCVARMGVLKEGALEVKPLIHLPS